MNRESFFVSGMGLERLLRVSLTVGFFFLAHMEGSFQKTRFDGSMGTSLKITITLSM